jgi:hypothetical protein
VCLDRNKGPLVYALRKDAFLGLFPVNPVPRATYRAAFPPSPAKDAPTAAALQLEPLVAQRRRLVGDTARLTNRGSAPQAAV